MPGENQGKLILVDQALLAEWRLALLRDRLLSDHRSTRSACARGVQRNGLGENTEGWVTNYFT
jgi:hypothetical protein